MDGVLNVLKPSGMTSFDVINYLRKRLNLAKAGHTGTLDPGAVGVLPVCIGRATRIAEYITKKTKVYRAELTLGISTDTQDSFGNIISQREVHVGLDRIEDVLKRFVGTSEQLPPMFSAIKVNGKKLYELAREGIETERKPRTIEIYSIELVHYKAPDKVLMDVKCSSGTYIRTLCHDIGEALGCGGHMSFLLRTASGSFRLEDAMTLEEITRSDEWKNRLVPIEYVLDDFPKCYLMKSSVKGFCNRAAVSAVNWSGIDSTVNSAINSTNDSTNDSTPIAPTADLTNNCVHPGTLFRVYQPDGVFLGIGKSVVCDGKMLIKADKLFV